MISPFRQHSRELLSKLVRRKIRLEPVNKHRVTTKPLIGLQQIHSTKESKPRSSAANDELSDSDEDADFEH